MAEAVARDGDGDGMAVGPPRSGPAPAGGTPGPQQRRRSLQPLPVSLADQAGYNVRR